MRRRGRIIQKKSDAAKRGSVLSHQEKRATKGVVYRRVSIRSLGVATESPLLGEDSMMQLQLATGCGNGSMGGLDRDPGG